MIKHNLLKTVSVCTLMCLSTAYADTVSNNVVSVSIKQDNLVQETLTISNLSANKINNLNIRPVADANSSLKNVVLISGNEKSCDSISESNPLAPNASCTIKVLNMQKPQAINLNTGVLAITANGINANTLKLKMNSGTTLYAGGYFTMTDGAYTNHLAVWDGQKWLPLANSLSKTDGTVGVNGPVHALAYANGNLIIGGRFTMAGGLAAHNIAYYGGSDNWGTFGSGTNGRVKAILPYNNSDLYVGGNFTKAGGVAARHIADFTSGTWSALGSGVNFEVDSIARLTPNLASVLAVGGDYHGKSPDRMHYVSYWDTSSNDWAPLGSGTNNNVYSLYYDIHDADNHTLYAGGAFTTAGDQVASLLAKTQVNNFADWKPVFNINASSVRAMADYSHINDTRINDPRNEIVLGGLFTIGSGPGQANNIATWDGSKWYPLGSGTNGMINTLITDTANRGDNIYAGGDFTSAGGQSVHNVAKWNGSTWQAMEYQGGFNNVVNSLTLAPYLSVTANVSK